MTRFSIAARSVARRMIAARIVGCSRLPSRPQKTGASPGGSRVGAEELSSSRASEGASGCRRGLPPLPRRTSSDGRGPSSSRSAQSSAISSAAAKAGLNERQQDEPVAFGEAGAPSWRVRGRGEQQRELLLGQPVGFLLRLRRRLELEERVGQAAAAAEPAQEAAQEAEAAVVGRRCRLGALLVGGEVVDDRRLLEDVPVTVAAPGEQIVDRDPVGGERALAPPRRLEPPQPVVSGLLQVRRCRFRRFLRELSEQAGEERDRIVAGRGSSRRHASRVRR